MSELKDLLLRVFFILNLLFLLQIKVCCYHEDMIAKHSRKIANVSSFYWGIEFL